MFDFLFPHSAYWPVFNIDAALHSSIASHFNHKSVTCNHYIIHDGFLNRAVYTNSPSVLCLQMKKDTILKSTTLEKELDVVMTQKQSLESANAQIDVEKTSDAVRTQVQDLVNLKSKLASARQRRRSEQEVSLGKIAKTKKR